jgi:hypothetical protein
MQVRDGSEVVSKERSLYTGVNTFEVVAIAPTVQEMKEVLGFDEPKAPAPCVDVDDKGNTRVRIDFWLTQPETENMFPEKKSFFITKVKRVSEKTGTTQHVNEVGQFGWWKEGGEIPSTISNFYNGEVTNRPAFSGEDEFVQFFQMYLNMKVGKDGDEFKLNWESIFNGDFTELRNYMKLANAGTPNRVGLLMGVRTVDGDNGPRHYQSIYRKQYGRGMNQDLNALFTRVLAKDGNEFTDDYQNSLVWQTYTPGLTTGETAGTSTTTTTTASVW